MKIIKLYLDNFKGVANPTVVNFSGLSSILKGPNGFGKTTIFDALELCLTGEIYRTRELAKVTEDRADYKDAFYRNKKTKPVVLHLLVETNKDEKFVIAKVLPANSTGKPTGNFTAKAYKADAWSIIQTYRLPEESFGLDNESIYMGDQISQDELDSQVLGSGNGTLTELYRLFGYLQQAENTFYLKKKEKDRKEHLDHLFKTDYEANVRDMLQERYKTLERLIKSIDQQLNGIEKPDKLEENIDYVKMFPWADFEIDSPKPFANSEISNIDQDYSDLRNTYEQINTLIRTFDPTEYAKDKERNALFALAKNDLFLNYIVLRDLAEDDAYKEVQELTTLNNLAENNTFLQYFITQDLITPEKLKPYQESTKFYKTFSDYTNAENRPSTIEQKLEYIRMWEEEVEANLRVNAEQILNNITAYQKSLSNSQSSLATLAAARQTLATSFTKRHSEKNAHSNEAECPMCGFDWETSNALQEAIKAKTESLGLLTKADTKQLDLLRKKAQSDIIDIVESRIEKYLTENNRQYNFLRFVMPIINGNRDNSYDRMAELLLKSEPSSKEFVWKAMASSTQLLSDVNILAQFIKEQCDIDKSVFTRLAQIRSYKFDDSIKHLRRYDIELIEPWRVSNIGDEDSLNEAIASLRMTIGNAAQKIAVDAEKLGGDLQYLYKEYFMEDAGKFTQGASVISEKLKYLDYEYRTNKRKTVRVLQTRRSKIDKILKKTGEAKGIYRKSLTDYKTEMIDKIRIPFYIYSAKILQNYQQGMGVFISTSGTRSGSIRFLTESGSDHDIVHHLSSGQLAVVSIAFSLAINKVYRDTSLNLICIDDPVYELDSLNIHSFVELLRRSFIGSFQVVLSTHDEGSASYMKYRFEKIHENSVSVIDVQDIFFKAKVK